METSLIARVLVVTSAALMVTACGTSASSDGHTSASPGRISPARLPTVPEVDHSAGAIADSRFGSCATAAGEQRVTGAVRNSATAGADYVVTVSWTNATYDVLARGVATLTAVAPGASRDFAVSAAVPSGATTCTFNVVRGALR